MSIETSVDSTLPEVQPAFRPETGIQTGRLSRNGVASQCGTQKATPAETSNVQRRYDEYGFVALESGCVTVTLTGGHSQLFSAAYNSNGLSILSPDTNYIADMGSSPINGIPTRSYSFNVSKGQVFHVVVHEMDLNGGENVNYELDVEGVKLTPDFNINESVDTDAPQSSYLFENAVTGNQTGRLNRTGGPATCDNPKPNPGINSPSGIRRRDLYQFVPVNSGCVQVSVSHTGSDQVHLIAYDENGFDPNATSDNYLADTVPAQSMVLDTCHLW